VKLRSLVIVALCLVALQVACAANAPSVAAPAPADSIPESEIQAEMQKVRTAADASPILLALAFGGAGAVVGWIVGCELNVGGGDDPGLDGCVGGGAIGAIGGLAAGVSLGNKLAEESRRAEAIRRIRARRASGEPVRP